MAGARIVSSSGSLPVNTGSLVVPARANWCGTVMAHSTTAPAVGSSASLEFVRESGAVDKFVGTVRRAYRSAGDVNASITIVGGKGKLLDELPPRDHVAGVTEIPAGLIARGICDDAGETLAAGVEAALDGYLVHHWTRFAMPGRDALDLLVDTLGLAWRVLADGTVWIGAETWPSFKATKFLSAIPDDAGASYACDGAPIRPGVTVATPEGDRRIVEVVYTIGGAMRATVRAAVPGDPPRAPSIDLYRATYAATVTAQDADGTLRLEADDPRLGDLRGIPFRLGAPGSLATVPAGARLRVRFEGADPRGAYACDVDADDAATAAVALVGDSCGALLFTPPGTLAVVPVGTPGSVALTILGPGHRYVKGVPGA